MEFNQFRSALSEALGKILGVTFYFDEENPTAQIRHFHLKSQQKGTTLSLLNKEPLPMYELLLPKCLHQSTRGLNNAKSWVEKEYKNGELKAEKFYEFDSRGNMSEVQ